MARWSICAVSHRRDPRNGKDAFPQIVRSGFDDSDDLKSERAYKVAAHERYQNLFANSAREWIASRNHGALVHALDAVYGDRRGAKDGPDARLNLLYQRIEEPAFFEALGRAEDPAFDYAAKALDFIEDPSGTSFDALRGTHPSTQY